MVFKFMKCLFALVFILSFLSAYTPDYTPYVPGHSMEQVLNATVSSCSPPGTVSGCANCRDEYKTDCVYYFASRPTDCAVVYTDDHQFENCINFVFWQKSRQSDDVVPTCKLYRSDTGINMCLMGWVSTFGPASNCNEIPTDTQLFFSYNQECFKQYARNYQEPQACTNLKSVDNGIDCCTAAKGVTEQYITTRPDLIESFTAKYGTKLEECKTLLGVKPAALLDKCEQVNCDCLAPCNSMQGDEQHKCAMQCSTEYIGCYDEEKTELVQESRDRFNQQSFYGMFSRKQCPEYQGLAGLLKNDNHKEKQEPAFCTDHNQCNKGRLCDSCGKCRDEKELVLPKDVTVSYEVKPDVTAIKLKNAITENGVFRVNVQTTLKDANEKQIGYCDVLYPGIKTTARLDAKFIDDDIFAGFTTGQLLDSRDKVRSCNIDFSQGSQTCPFIVSPNDRKKPVGLVKQVIERIGLTLFEQKENSKEEIIENADDALELTLDPIDLNLQFEVESNQVQQGTNRILKFTANDPDSKMVLIHAKVIGPATIFMPKEEAIDLKNLHFTAVPNEQQQIGFKAPEISSFDLGKEIESLSMADLQKEAGKQILTDAAFATVDVGLDKAGEAISKMTKADEAALEAYKRYIKTHPDYRSAEKTSKAVMDLGKAKAFEEGANMLTNEYKFGKGFLNDLPGVHSGIKDSQAAVGQNVDDSLNTKSYAEQNANNNDNSPGLLEKGANMGVTAITVTQLGVSVLTFVPNKIPGVNKLTAGFQVAFSAATNIWKANLKYIAQTEKINRAQEKFVPVVVFVTAEDLSGWQASSAVTMKVAYIEV